MSIAKTEAGVEGKVAENWRPKPADADMLLVERVKAGDSLAFDELTKKYRQRLYSAKTPWILCRMLLLTRFPA